MNHPATNDEERERRLDEAVTAWMKAAEAGDTPEPHDWLARYADLAPELESFFAAEEEFGRIAAPWREAARITQVIPTGGDAETIGQATGPGKPPPLSQGRTFGEYELVEEIARGGMGVVYKARQTRLNRTVAVKMILAGQLADKDEVRRFLAEAEAAAALDHAGIVPVYESGQIDGQHFFSMGYVDGESLAAQLTAGPLQPRRAAELLGHVADAVEYAHQQGVIHRDLKPGNILLDKNGHPRVTDFGLAKRITSDSGLTHTGQALGTPSYMPPEQAAGRLEEIGPASDVYALGAVLYAALTGRPPFQAASQFNTLLQVIEQEPAPPRQLNLHVPRDLETITLKCLRKEPRKRYPTAAQFADELRRFLSDRPIEARRSSRVERLLRWSRRNKSLAASLVILASLLALVTVGSVLAAAYFSQEKKIQAALAFDKGELAKKFEAAANEANAARRETETTLADMQTARGLSAADRGEAATALLWFANAAGLTPHDRVRQRENRVRAKLWSQQAVSPIAALALNEPISLVEFQPGDNRILALGYGGRCLIWDWKDSVALPWTEKLTDVRAACWSRDGSQVALALASGSVQIRSTLSGAVIARIEHPQPATALAFSRDGSRLAVASNLVRLWSLNGDPALEMEWPHPKLVYSLAFDSSGNRLVTACRDKQARVYSCEPDSKAPTPLFAPLVHDPRKPRQPALLNDDRWLVTIVRNEGIGQLGWWDMRTGRPATIGAIDRPAVSWPNCVRASDDGKKLVLTGFPKFQVWDFSKTPARSFVGEHRNELDDACFSADGLTLLTASWDQTAQLWSVADGRRIGSGLPHMKIVNHCRFASDGSHLLTGQSDGLVRVWRIPSASNDFVRQMEWKFASERRPRQSGDGRFAVGGALHESVGISEHSSAAQFTVTDVQTGKTAAPAIDLKGFSVDSCILPDNRSVAVVSVDEGAGWLAIFEIMSGRPIAPARPLPSPPRSIAARPTGNQIAVFCRDGELQLFNARDGTPGAMLRHGSVQGQRARAFYTPDGSALIEVLDNNDSVWVRDADSLKLRYRPIMPVLEGGPLRGLDVSSDSKLLATAVNGKNAVQVWNLATGRALCRPLEHPGDYYGLFDVRFSPDGRFLLSAHKDGQARYWDWQHEKLACPALEHDDEVYDAAITSDGNHAITACRDGTARVWELTTGKLVAPVIRVGAPLKTVSRGERVTLLAGDAACYAIDVARLLSEPDSPTEQLALLGEVAAAKRIELGDLSPLTARQWSERFETLREARDTPAATAELLSRRLDGAALSQERETIAARAAQSSSVLERLARLRPALPEVQMALARSLKQKGDWKAARDHLQTARSAYEKQLAAHRDDATLMDGLARSILELWTTWTVLEPLEMKSQAGEMLAPLPDGSILVSGVNPSQDVYTVTAAPLIDKIASIKLEMLAHDSLPYRGPGRAPTGGNFVLSDLSLALTAQGTISSRRLPLTGASADYSQAGFNAMQAIDDHVGTGWAIWPKRGEDHDVVFDLADAESVPSGDLVTITLRFESAYEWHQAGRFRIHVGDHTNAALAEYVRRAMDAGQARGAAALGASYFVIGDTTAANEWLSRSTKQGGGAPLEGLLLALVRRKLGDETAARQMYNRSMAEMSERLAADEIQALAIRAAVEVAGLAPRDAATAVAKAQDSAQLTALSATIDSAPSDWEAYRARGNFSAGRARWKEAADDWRQMVRIAPANDLFWLDLATLLAAGGDMTAYREHCQRMLDHFAGTQDPLTADKVVKACSLLPEAVDDFAKVAELADRGTRLAANDVWRPVIELSKSLADYRRGHFDAASSRLASLRNRSLTLEYRASYEVVFALASHQLNDEAAARRQLDAGSELIRRHVPDFSHTDTFHLNWVFAEVLRREAASLIDGSAASGAPRRQ